MPTAKYLKVVLDSNITYGAQIPRTASTAAGGVASLDFSPTSLGFPMFLSGKTFYMSTK